MAKSWRKSLAAGLAATALGVAGCGEEGSIPRGDAQALLRTLDEVEAKVEQGDCAGAETDATQLVGAVNQLPAEVGAETKELLRTTAENLVRLTADQCEVETAPTGVEEVPTETTTTTPTTPTTTETTTTDTTTTEPEEGAPEPDQEGEDGEGENGEGD